MNIYFSDIFDLDPDLIESYGAFNISLINDLPLFIDPFLLFNSEKQEYCQLHKEVLEYVAFLRDMSAEEGIRHGLLSNWFCFPEVKQNWFGYSRIGNGGSGLGKGFALALNKNLHHIFSNFGKETITRSSHLEKLCLIKSGVGRDNISDFTTNLIKRFLLRYTQTFAQTHIDQSMRKMFVVDKVWFNYSTHSWVPERYDLPAYKDEFVLLTPKDILTKEDTWINKSDITEKFRDIVLSVPNEQLRDQINMYFISRLPSPEKKKRGKGEKMPSKKEIAAAITDVVIKYPALIDYYIRYKEENGAQATSISEEHVQEIQDLFIRDLSGFIHSLCDKSEFYQTGFDTLDESYARVLFRRKPFFS